MVIPGSRLVFHGSRWVLMVFSKFQVDFSWFQVGFEGNSWFKVSCHGFSWFLVGFHGFI